VLWAPLLKTILDKFLNLFLCCHLTPESWETGMDTDLLPQENSEKGEVKNKQIHLIPGTLARLQNQIDYL
jgi:hypothetical protein